MYVYIERETTYIYIYIFIYHAPMKIRAPCWWGCPSWGKKSGSSPCLRRGFGRVAGCLLGWEKHCLKHAGPKHMRLLAIGSTGCFPYRFSYAQFGMEYLHIRSHVCVSVRACVRACVHACVRGWVGGCDVCVSGCVRVCVCACACVMCATPRLRVFHMGDTIDLAWDVIRSTIDG